MNQESQGKSSALGTAERAPGRTRERASYLGRSVGDALAGTFGALSGRLSGRKVAAGGVGKRRLEEVLERDRALRDVEPPQRPVTAKPVVPQPPAPATAEPASGPAKARPRRELDDGATIEPIRTRTMARLLASQGYVKRAAAIYSALLDEQPDDEALQNALAALLEQS